MSTQLQKNKKKKQLPKIPDLRVGIVVAEWNEHITEALLKGALDVFEKEGYSQNAILVDRVPGTVELTYGAARMINTMDLDAIIVFGCVIRGDTPHFDILSSRRQRLTTVQPYRRSNPMSRRKYLPSKLIFSMDANDCANASSFVEP